MAWDESPFGDSSGVSKIVAPTFVGDQGMIMEDHISDIGTAATNTPQATPKATTKQICGGFGEFHQWEACSKASFVIKGCLTGKSCHVCLIPFEGTKPTLKKPLYHCTFCKLGYCFRCKWERDAKSPPRRCIGNIEL